MEKPRILVADDSLTIQKVIRLSLANESYEIFSVSDGKDVLAKALETRPHAILVDIALPNRNGFEIREDLNLNTHTAAIPVILMLSAFKTVDQKLIQKAGFQGKLVKPFDPSHLRETLLNALRTFQANQPAQTPPKETKKKVAPPPLPPEAIKKFHVTPDSFLAGSKWSGDDLQSGEDDIRKLTSSTFESVEKNEFEEWSIQDLATGAPDLAKPDSASMTPSKSKITAPTAPVFAKTPAPEEDEDPDGFQEFLFDTEPTPEPTPRTIPKEMVAAVMQEDFSIPAPAPTSGSRPNEESTEYRFLSTKAPPIETKSARSSTSGHGELGLSEADLQKLIQEKVEERLKKMAIQMLPDLAERIIKEEINRMLSESR